jgi:hypothetical protein
VAANTLIGVKRLKKGDQGLLIAGEIEEKQNELLEIRHQYFSTRNAKDKKNIRKQDKLITKELSGLLKKDGFFNSTDAAMLAKWDPYCQTKPSDFFDANWMFGLQQKNSSLISADQEDTGFFDIVIGNPPYVQIKQIPWDDRRVFETLYKSATGRFNLFYLFLERSINLAKINGLSAFIIPDRFLLNTQCANLRQLLLNEQTLLEIDTFDDSIFESAVVDSVIILYRNNKLKYPYIKTKSRANIHTIKDMPVIEIPFEHFITSPSNQFDISYNIFNTNLIQKIRSGSVSLGEIAKIKDGIIQGKISDLLFLKKRIDNKSKKILFGEDIKRYYICFNNNWVNYKPDEMMKIEISRRGKDVRPGLWMRIPEIFECEKILTRQTADEIIAAYDRYSFYYSNTLHGTTITNSYYDILYVLAILNSKLLTWYYRVNTAEEGKVFAQIKIALLKLLPIREANKNTQKIIVDLVKKINLIKGKNHSTDTSVIERKIDNLVFRLYNLTYDEVKIIEPNFPLSKVEYEEIELINRCN